MRKCVFLQSPEPRLSGLATRDTLEWLLALLPHKSFEICCNPVEMSGVSRYPKEFVKKGMRRDFPREPFPPSTVLVKGKTRKSVGFWVISVGICKQTRQQ